LAYAREAGGACSPQFDVFPSTEAVLMAGRARGAFRRLHLGQLPISTADLCARRRMAQWRRREPLDEPARAHSASCFDGKPLVPGVKALLGAQSIAIAVLGAGQAARFAARRCKRAGRDGRLPMTACAALPRKAPKVAATAAQGIVSDRRPAWAAD